MTTESEKVLKYIKSFPAGSLLYIKGENTVGGTQYSGIIQKLSHSNEDNNCCVIKGAKLIVVEECTRVAADIIKDNVLLENVKFKSLEKAIYFICGRKDTKIHSIVYILNKDLKVVGKLFTLMSAPAKLEESIDTKYNATEKEMCQTRRIIMEGYKCSDQTDRYVSIDNLEDTNSFHHNEIDVNCVISPEAWIEKESSDTEVTRTIDSEIINKQLLEDTDPSLLLAALIKSTQKQLEIKNNIVSLSEDTLNSISKLLKTESEEAVKVQFDWGESEEKNQFEEVYGFNIENAIMALKSKKALLLQGVPGTGKTIAMGKLINSIVGGDQDKYKIISFGQNTSYKDFIGGLYSNNGVWEYTDGIFVQMCKKAFLDKSNIYILGIDEISRGNTEEILGEAITGLESRGRKITLGNGELIVPNNLYIIGTMNITDRSTSTIDIATLQRFSIQKLEPQWENKEYISSIAGDNKEIEKQLWHISNSMVCINKIIKEDKLLTDNNIIGTRCITIQNITNELVKQAVTNNIRSTVEANIKNASNKTKDSIREELENLLEKLGINK